MSTRKKMEGEKKKEKKGEEAHDEEAQDVVETPALPPATRRVFINNVDEWVGRAIAGE